MELIKRVLTPPVSSYLLFGPRGTGKSTWLNQVYQDAYWINLLEPDTFRLYSARPERLIEVVRKNRSATKTFIIDEVQEVPQLLSAVHLLMEEDKSTCFILTGSSARKLKRTGVDLLAARALLNTMHSFMVCELGDRFDLNSALQVGTIPLIVSSEEPEKKLSTYISVYLQEEVKHEGLVRKIGDFSRFLEVISFSHGAEINASNIARECGIGRKAVESYISITQDLLLSYTVPAFVKKSERSPVSHPKFYFFDCGIYQSLRPKGPLDRPEEIAGPALEGLVAQHLRAYLAYANSASRLYYWRTYAGAEVDFVVYGPDTFIAIEVKNTVRLRTEDFRGLRSFSSFYPLAQRVLLYRGHESLLTDNVHCVPVDTFLKNLHPSRTLSSIV